MARESLLPRLPGEQEAVDLLTETLEKEKDTERKLTQTERDIMPAAMGDTETKHEEPARSTKSAGRAKAVQSG
jgi:hypothetical protein